MPGRAEGGAVPPACQLATAAFSRSDWNKGGQTDTLAFLHTPLCPAGHLPRKGGDRLSPAPPPNLQRCLALPSPLDLPSRHTFAGGRILAVLQLYTLRQKLVADAVG